MVTTDSSPQVESHDNITRASRYESDPAKAPSKTQHEETYAWQATVGTPFKPKPTKTSVFIDKLNNDTFLMILDLLDPASKVCLALTSHESYELVISTTGSELRSLCRRSGPYQLKLDGPSDHEKLMKTLWNWMPSTMIYCGRNYRGYLSAFAIKDQARQHIHCDCMKSLELLDSQIKLSLASSRSFDKPVDVRSSIWEEGSLLKGRILRDVILQAGISILRAERTRLEQLIWSLSKVVVQSGGCGEDKLAAL